MSGFGRGSHSTKVVVGAVLSRERWPPTSSASQLGRHGKADPVAVVLVAGRDATPEDVVPEVGHAVVRS